MSVWDMNAMSVTKLSFGWDRVKVLHSSSYGASIWIGDQNSVDN